MGIKTQTLKKQIKKLEHYDVHERTLFERFGSIALTGLLFLSIVETSHETAKRFMVREVIAPITHVSASPEPVPAEKSETVRMPIKFDDGLRATATTGA